jgi:hypothetical protein
MTVCDRESLGEDVKTRSGASRRLRNRRVAALTLGPATALGALAGVGVVSAAPTPVNVLTAPWNPTSVAIDSVGDLYIYNPAAGTVQALAKSTGTIFGTPVIANVLTTVATADPGESSLAFDPAGDLFIANS